MDYKKTYIFFQEKFDKFSKRERVLILCTLLTCVYFLWQTIVFDQLFGSKEQIQQSTQKIRDQINRLQGQISDISENIKQDPLFTLMDKIEEMETENKALDEQLEKLTEQLIPPSEMTKLLSKMLIQDKDLKVIRVENLTEKPLFNLERTEERQIVDRFQVYRHGLEMEFIGTYFSTIRFLEKVENLSWKILWDELSYTVEQYPQARVKLRFYTLSLQRGWISP